MSTRLYYDNEEGDGPRIIEAGRLIVFHPKGEVWAKVKKRQEIVDDKGRKRYHHVTIWEKTGRVGAPICFHDLSPAEFDICRLRGNADRKLLTEQEWQGQSSVGDLDRQIAYLESIRNKKSAALSGVVLQEEPAVPTAPVVPDLSRFPKIHLQELARGRGLDAGGRREDLIARIEGDILEKGR